MHSRHFEASLSGSSAAEMNCWRRFYAQVERKYRGLFTVIHGAKIRWAMNKLQKGRMRRIEQEGDGIFNWALEGLRLLNKRGYLGGPEGVKGAPRQFRINKQRHARPLRRG